MTYAILYICIPQSNYSILMAQICKIQWRFPEAKPLSSQVISNRHKHTLENTRSCEKSISTEINSEHTRNLNGTLEITKKKKKTTTTTLQECSG